MSVTKGCDDEGNVFRLSFEVENLDMYLDWSAVCVIELLLVVSDLLSFTKVDIGFLESVSFIGVSCILSELLYLFIDSVLEEITLSDEFKRFVCSSFSTFLLLSKIVLVTCGKVSLFS
jgi:hypothetical protein